MASISDILLVIPIRSGYSGITIDLGLLHIYGALKDSGLSATIIHCPKDNIDEVKWKELLISNPDIKIIGFKAFSVDHNSIKRMSSYAKEILPQCTTVVGGPHPTTIPEYVLNDIPTIDYVFLGEGEVGVPELFKNILSGQSPDKVPGLAYRAGGRFVFNKQEIIDNLDQLPRIRWEDVNIEQYPNFFSSLPFIPIMATRGCPFLCKYCAAHTVVGRKMRYRSVKNVVEELRFLKETKGVEGVNFSDDELTLNRKYFVDLCYELINSKLDIKWECSNGVRLDTLDEEVIDLMYKAGCRYVAVGIESASDDILKRMNKNINTETIREKISLIKRSKLIPQGLFMIGFPGETAADIKKTIQFSIELDIDKTNFSIFMPLPGSEIFHELVDKGEISLNEINWDNMKPDKIVWRNHSVSPRRLKFLQRYAYLRFYIRPRPIKRLLKEFAFKEHGLSILFSKIKSVFLR